MYIDYQTEVFPDSFCSGIIKNAELEGFKEAKINNHGNQQLDKAIRNNFRILCDFPILAKHWEQVLTYPIKLNEMKFSHIGSFMRVYKYWPGQYFKPHRDGSVLTDSGEESMLTVLIYLNDNPTAGTIVYPYGYGQKWAAKELPCVTGSVAIFDHNLWHEGKVVEHGVKYVLRTDIFYKN